MLCIQEPIGRSGRTGPAPEVPPIMAPIPAVRPVPPPVLDSYSSEESDLDLADAEALANVCLIVPLQDSEVFVTCFVHRLVVHTESHGMSLYHFHLACTQLVLSLQDCIPDGQAFIHTLCMPLSVLSSCDPMQLQSPAGLTRPGLNLHIFRWLSNKPPLPFSLCSIPLDLCIYRSGTYLASWILAC